MIKRLAGFWLLEGTDPDQFWEYHTRVHAADVIKVCGPLLKKYHISRITGGITGKLPEPPMFVIVEMWYENNEDMEKASRLLDTTKLQNGKTAREDFALRVAGGFSAVTEEFIAK